MPYGAEIILLIILLILSGFFSGTEVALISLTKSKAEHLVKQKKTWSYFYKKVER